MPVITAVTPINKPAVAAKTFPDWWLMNINIHMPPGQQGRCNVTYVPWNHTTNQADETDRRYFVIPDLLDKLGGDPDFLEAWEKVTFVVAKYMAEAEPPLAQEPEEE